MDGVKCTERFQSLLGFLTDCDVGFGQDPGSSFTFQSLLGFLIDCDFDRLKQLAGIMEFQSLLGFLIDCDKNITTITQDVRSVSIPIGFSDRLRLCSR